jgi:hypothetical protein
MLYTILFSLLIIIFAHVTYKYVRDTLTPLKTKDVYTFQNEKFGELIRALENKKPEIDFASMEDELSNLLNSEIDIKTTDHII